MQYDKDLVASKLRRWETYLDSFRLPEWEEIPDLGLYMEQLTVLLQEYLDYLPPELKEEQFITPSTINNYVRTKVMPEPIKRRYYREHIAYLIIILTLKHSLSIALIQRVIPRGISKAEVEQIYTAYVSRHRKTAELFIEQMRLLSAPLLGDGEKSERSTDSPEALIVTNAVMSGFTRLLTEKLLLLEGKTIDGEGETKNE